MISRCGWRMELCLNQALSSPSSNFKVLNEDKRGRQVMLKQSMMQGSVSLQRRGVWQRSDEVSRIRFSKCNLKDMIELDTYGYSDHSIELSSDEEGNPGDQVIQSMKWWKLEKVSFQDVLLDVMKRPPVNTHDRQQPIEILEILDSDEVETFNDIILNWLKNPGVSYLCDFGWKEWQCQHRRERRYYSGKKFRNAGAVKGCWWRFGIKNSLHLLAGIYRDWRRWRSPVLRVWPSPLPPWSHLVWGGKGKH